MCSLLSHLQKRSVQMILDNGLVFLSMVSQMHKEHTLFHSLDTIDKSLQFRDHILSTESPPTSNHHHSIENRKKSDPIDGISWANSTIPVLTLFTFIDPDSSSRSLSLLLCIFICGRSDDSNFLFFL